MVSVPELLPSAVLHLPGTDEAEPATASPVHFQRNSVASVHHLPIEILETIFIHCSYQHYGDTAGFPLLSLPSWVHVSHVGRLWRNVALNCPTLWSYLFITSPCWTKELLSRSKQTPLKLRVNLNHDSSNEVKRGLRFLEQVMPHAGRIEEVRLFLSRGGDRALSKLSTPAPCLRNLEITVDQFSGGFFSAPFCGETPALRTLVLTGSPIPWHSLELSGLTTLNLSYLPPEYQQNMEEFLTTLSCMQDLAHLYLLDAIASDTNFLSSTEKITLPNLSRLYISAPPSTTVTFLLCVDVPLNAEIRLDWDYSDPPSIGEFIPLFPLLAERFALSGDQAVPKPTIRRLIMARSKHEATKLTFSTSECDRDPFTLDCIEWGSNIPLQIFLPSSECTATEPSISDILCTMPLGNVQSLHVFEPALSRTLWADILGHLQDLRHLKMSDGGMPDLASVLSFPPRNLTDYMRGQGNLILAPALEELELCNIRFLTSLEGNSELFHLASLRSLCDALATRKEPRGQLIMTRCSEDTDCGRGFDMAGWWGGGCFHVVGRNLLEG